MKKRSIVVILVSILCVYLMFTSMFVVREDEYAIIFEFGKCKKVIDHPGLYWKKPNPVQAKLILSKKIIMCDPASKEFLTSDKKSIVVDYYFTYRIQDPLSFHKTLKDRAITKVILEDLTASALSTTLGRFPLLALISVKADDIKLSNILVSILRKGNNDLADTGLNIMDLQIKRLVFPKENESSIFARMYSERQRIATKYRAEGMEAARKIKAEARLQADIKKTKARKAAEAVKGRADAKAMGIMAQTYKKDPELYEYIRQIQIYRDTIGEKDILILQNENKNIKATTAKSIRKTAKIDFFPDS